MNWKGIWKEALFASRYLPGRTEENQLGGGGQPDEIYETGTPIIRLRFSAILVLRVHYVAAFVPCFLRQVVT
jgi:hypothetical protein